MLRFTFSIALLRFSTLFGKTVFFIFSGFQVRLFQIKNFLL